MNYFLIIALLIVILYNLEVISYFEDRPIADAVFGVAKGFKEDEAWKGMSADECKQLAEEKKFVAWGHHNDSHEDDDLKNSCFMYSEIKPYKGDDTNLASMITCTKETNSVLHGCKFKMDEDKKDELKEKKREKKEEKANKKDLNKSKKALKNLLKLF